MTAPLSDQALLDYSDEHLMHELSMLFELGDTLPGRKAGMETSALLESFATHLRNLIEFFFYPSKGEYVRAQDFFDDPATWSPPLNTDLTKLLERANNQVSHLTRNRVSGNPPEKVWRTAEMVKQIEIIGKEFAEKASDKKLHAHVRELLTLPREQILLWISENVAHANVAAQRVTSASTPLPHYADGTSTATIVTIKRTLGATD